MQRVLTVGVMSVWVLCAGFLWAAGPVSSFEKDKAGGVVPGGVTLERVKEHATDGEYAAKVLFPGSEKDSWPGLNVPVSGITTGDDAFFVVDVFNPASEAKALGFRIDAEGKTRIFGSSNMKPGANTFRVSFAKVKPEATGKAVSKVFVYVRKPREDVTFYLDNMRVEAGK